MTQTQPLTSFQMAVLEFERAWWKHPGAKDQAVRDLFGISPTRHAAVVLELLDHPAAEVYDAELVRRLRRLRAGRQQARAAGGGGW